MTEDHQKPANKKDEQLEKYRVRDKGKKMTTNQGLKISEDEITLTAGKRGPTLNCRKDDVKPECR